MIAVYDGVAGVELMHGAVAEGGFGEFAAAGFDGGLMGDLAEGDDDFKVGQGFDLALEERAAGVNF